MTSEAARSGSMEKHKGDPPDKGWITTGTPTSPLPTTLEELLAQNEARWNTIESLHRQLNNTGDDKNDGHGFDRHSLVAQSGAALGAAASTTPQLSAADLEIAALRAELSLLYSRSTAANSNNATATTLARTIVGEARRHQSTIFTNEIVQSYEELCQVHDTLDRLILNGRSREAAKEQDGTKTESEPLSLASQRDSVQRFVKQHQVLHRVLLDMMRGQRHSSIAPTVEAGEGTNESCRTAASMPLTSDARFQEGTEDCTDRTLHSLQEENEWLRRECKYAAQMMCNCRQRKRAHWKTDSNNPGEAISCESSNVEDEEDSVMVGPMDVKETKRRKSMLVRHSPVNVGNVKSTDLFGVATPLYSTLTMDSTQPLLLQHLQAPNCIGLHETKMWTLDQLIVELTYRLLSSPSDPYLIVPAPAEAKHAPDATPAAIASPIQWEHVEFLKQCSVVELHPDNECLIRIVDYLQ